MKLCDYGCGREAHFLFKNGKWCCSEHWKKCPEQRKKTGPLSEEHKKKISEAMKGKILSEEHKKKIGKGNKGKKTGKKTGPLSEETKRKISKSLKGKKKPPRSEEHKKKISKLHKGKILSKEHRKKLSEVKIGKKTAPLSEEHKKKISEAKKGKKTGPLSEETKIRMRYTLKDYEEKYPFFSNIEEMRYTPNKLNGIQVHCKNHECENSKEKGGWFTPTSKQIQDRKNFLENEGLDNSYFYCSQHCKDTCLLYGLRGDPNKEINKPYTSTEKEVFNEHILERDNEICYYCGEHTATIVHHLRPQKLEPFFALDPDYAVSVCAKCHYKHGHPTGSKYSTGNLAKIVCSIESQKFLNQK